jgi:hypothetical protein
MISKQLGIAIMAMASLSANAATVTHGNLSSDDTTSIIVDSQNNVEYLRFDILASSTYAQTLAQLDTVAGGGWSIADSTVAVNFTSAILGGDSGCTHNGTNVTTSFCGTIPSSPASWADGDFGENTSVSTDNVWFMDELGDVDMVVIHTVGRVYIADIQQSLAWTDQFAAGGAGGADSIPVAWMLVRPSEVPLPAAMWLFGSGLLGLIGFGRRRQLVTR